MAAIGPCEAPTDSTFGSLRESRSQGHEQISSSFSVWIVTIVSGEFRHKAMSPWSPPPNLQLKNPSRITGSCNLQSPTDILLNSPLRELRRLGVGEIMLAKRLGIRDWTSSYLTSNEKYSLRVQGSPSWLKDVIRRTSTSTSPNTHPLKKRLISLGWGCQTPEPNRGI